VEEDLSEEATMKTRAEIVARIDYLADGYEDFLGFQRDNLVDALVAFEHAQPYLKEGITKEEWENGKNRIRTDEDVLAQMRDYMPFAQGKARNHRGISATRSIERYKAWAWLLGDDLVLEYLGTDDNWGQYGAKMLKYLCGYYKFDWPADDDILNAQALGEICPACLDGSESGCGR